MQYGLILTSAIIKHYFFVILSLLVKNHKLFIICGKFIDLLNIQIIGPRSTVGNVSGNRRISDCRSRGRKFDPGPAHTFVEIDHEIISTAILLPSAESFKKGCCQLQAIVCAQITG